MHAGSGGQVPGDDERWINIVYDERGHRDQLSGGDRLRGRDVHVNGWAELVQQLRRQQLLEHGGRGGDELHSLPDEQCSGGRRNELLLQQGLLRERSDALDRRDVHAGSGWQVPGAGRWDDIVYDERHDDQLSGGD